MKLQAENLSETDIPELKRNRNAQKRERTRQLILDSASTLFREKGVASTTVNDVMVVADVAYGLFYKHFRTMEDVASTLAKTAILSMIERTGEIMASVDEVELLPCVGARVVVRLVLQDPSSRWLLERTEMFVEEFTLVGRSFMISAEAEAVASGELKPAGGHEVWLRIMPWILVGELRDAIAAGNAAAHEESFAAVSMRILGVDDARAPELLRRSEKLVTAHGLLPVAAGQDAAPLNA